MTPEQILAEPPRILSRRQRETYFADGYLMLESLISEDWLNRLRAVTDDFVAQSRHADPASPVFDLAPGHSAARPMVRRIKEPDGRHPLYWQFANDVIADVVADLVGPDVVFHHSKLNFKWHDGTGGDSGNEVHWHQDIQFYPHTNYSPLTVGTYLYDVGPDDGPVAILPRSHDGPLYDQYDDQGQWTGRLSDQDAARLDLSDMRLLTGPAGSITVHNCRTVHGSPPSRGGRDGRPLLLNAYASADAFAYTPNPSKSAHYRAIIRGAPARWAHHDPRPCLIPPDWSAGYSSIFAAQAGQPGGDDRAAAGR